MKSVRTKTRLPLTLKAILVGATISAALVLLSGCVQTTNENFTSSKHRASKTEVARVAGHGIIHAHEQVITSCFPKRLRRLLAKVSKHYGKPVYVTSGHRSKAYNRKVNGRKRSAHLTCEAADIGVKGVSKYQLAKYVRGLRGIGGVGVYRCSPWVHIDIRQRRDWNWTAKCGSR